MTRSTYIIESIENATFHLRANHKFGLRCHDCGRMLSHVQSLPAVRTCPNDDCGAKYHLSRSNKNGVGVRKL